MTLTAGDIQQVRTVMPTRSYLSQVELPLTFGMGDADHVEAVIVRWPNGEEEAWTDLAVDRLQVLRKGLGVTL